jgi:hypothetical protein
MARTRGGLPPVTTSLKINNNTERLPKTTPLPYREHSPTDNSFFALSTQRQPSGGKMSRMACRLTIKIRNNRQETAKTTAKRALYMRRVSQEPDTRNSRGPLAEVHLRRDCRPRQNKPRHHLARCRTGKLSGDSGGAAQKLNLPAPLCNEKGRVLFSHLDDDLLFRR